MGLDFLNRRYESLNFTVYIYISCLLYSWIWQYNLNIRNYSLLVIYTEEWTQ